MTETDFDEVATAFSFADDGARKKFMEAFLQSDGAASVSLGVGFFETAWAGDHPDTDLAIRCLDKALSFNPKVVLDTDMRATLRGACGLDTRCNPAVNRNILSLLLRRAPRACAVVRAELELHLKQADEFLSGKTSNILQTMAVFLRDGEAHRPFFDLAKSFVTSASSQIRESAMLCVQAFYEIDALGVSSRELQELTTKAVSSWNTQEGRIAYDTVAAIIRGNTEGKCPEGSIVDRTYVASLRETVRAHENRKGKPNDNIALNLLHEVVAARPSLESMAFPEAVLRKAISQYNIPAAPEAKAPEKKQENCLSRLWALVARYAPRTM